MNIACKREFKRMWHTMSEVIMKNLNLTMDTFMHRRWKLPILVFLLLVLGIFFTPADSLAQAVPPRSQTLQLIRPLVPAPEPPLEKEIRQLKREVQAETPAQVYRGQLGYLRRQLACYAQCVVKNGKICGGPIPLGAEKNPRRFCDLRMKAIRHQIQEMEARLAEGKE